MYNLFYNDIKNKVAVTYIGYIAANPSDLIAFKNFVLLLYTPNIARDSKCIFGNNTNLNEMEMYFECRKKSL